MSQKVGLLENSYRKRALKQYKNDSTQSKNSNFEIADLFHHIQGVPITTVLFQMLTAPTQLIRIQKLFN